jgi:WD40 repeat protein/3',5'-cyclic AMP phosphodiesterase CpdA
MTTAEASAGRFVVRVVGPDGTTAGVGTLVGAAELITCARAVNAALGLDPHTQERPADSFTVEFPLLDAPGQGARVRQWWPPPQPGVAGRPGTAGDDIAGLELLDGRLPAGARPARLAVTPPRPGQEVRVFGFPGTLPPAAGTWVTSTVLGLVGGGLLRLDSGVDGMLRTQPGFRGGPVVDADSGRVLGLLGQAPPGRPAERDCYAIGTDRLRLAWPEALDRRAVTSGPTEPREQLTVLHVSDPQFGRHHLFGGNGLTPADQAYDTLHARLHADLAGLADRHHLHPDLMVVTGDLAEWGLRSELDDAFRFLAELAEAVELPRSRVAVVPGNHDVNRKACEGYFATEEADERSPVPPYFPKWKQFVAAFEDFYTGVTGVSFSPDEPWTLFEIPDLAVVVAGLNSTMAESHRDGDHYGWLGEAQLHWFAGRLASHCEQGWLRLAAVHHNAVRGAVRDDENLRDADDLDRILGEPGLVNLLLHGHTHDGRLHRLGSGLVVLSTGSAAVAPDARPAEVPNQYQLVTVTADGFTRHARQYAPGQRRWIADTRISRNGSDWIDHQPHPMTSAHGTFPPPAVPPIEEMAQHHGRNRRRPESGFRDDGLLGLVAEATRVRHPDATVVARPGYLRVSNPLPDGGGVDMWPVGVVEAEDDLSQALDRFVAQVHARFASANPAVRSQLVYAGAPAPDQLVRRARGKGVRLRSFVDYQGLLDLHPLVARQAARLEVDRLYPPALYIPQRYRLVKIRGEGEIDSGLAERVIDWLRASDARFVMVLGDFGRGKTALLRHIARTLPAVLPDLLPILVELRSLEKAPSLDELLVQHLVRQEVEDIDLAKLRYMIRTGQLALLFDGFDELELRVGYDNAADYLATLLASVTADTQAKVVLTSRTQHFRSTGQVSNALGERVAAVTPSRIVELADFSADQIRQFLTSRYAGDTAAADARFDLLTEIEDLLGLARNPRMLEFIAALDEDRLREVQRREGRISAAELYRELVDFWLVGEADRQRHRRGVPSLDEQERLAACTELAKRLWSSSRPTIPESDLSAAVSATLNRLAERSYTAEQAAHSVGSGSLLVRAAEGIFTFVHQSIMEWLVANAAAEDLRAHEAGDLLAERPLSPLMADFLCDLAGRPVAHRWATGVLADPDAPQAAKQNALAIDQRFPTLFRRTGESPRQDLAGVDLRRHDLTSYELRGADLRGAVLRDMRLEGIDLSNADLREADFTGARLYGGSLRGARLDGSRWDRAALRGVGGLGPVLASPELAAAAIPGRDPATAQQPAAGPATCVAFSPDGALLAVGRGSAVELINWRRAYAVRTLSSHGRGVNAVAFSPDGDLLATASTDDTAHIWDTATGAHRTALAGHTGEVTDVAFSSDATLVATASRDRTARIWDATTGELRTTLTGHTHPVTALAFAPDDSLLATASRDNTIRFWDATGRCRATLTGHRRPVTAIAFSQSGIHLASASQDETARIWDVGSGTHLATLTGHTDWVTAISYLPGDRLVTASHDGTASSWDAGSGARISTLAEPVGAATTIAVTPSGAVVAIAADGTVHLWEVALGAQVTIATKDSSPVSACAFSPDGTRLATLCNSGANVWDASSGRQLGTMHGSAQLALAVAYSPDGTQLATAGRGGAVHLWDATTQARQTTLLGHTDWVNAIAYSPDGTQLATASSDRTVRLWDAASGAPIATVARSFDRQYAVAYSPDGTEVATGSRDNSVHVWLASTGQLHKTFTGHTAAVRGVAYSPDGFRLATASDDKTIRIWGTVGKAPLATLTGHEDRVDAVVFSPDGTQLASGSADSTARLWNAATGARIGALVGHAGPINSVAYSPDGTQLATASDDGTIRLWDPRALEHLATLIVLPEDGYAVLFPDGSYKLAGDAGDVLWWAVKLCRFAPGELDPYVPELQRVPDDRPIRPPR